MYDNKRILRGDKNIFYKIDERHILAFVGLLVIVSFSMVYLIDLHNFMGIRDFFQENYDSYPFFWYHWFENGGPIEVCQYLLLGFAALSGVNNAANSKVIAGGIFERSAKFWAIMGVAFLFMLIEDAGDVRHMIRVHIQNILGESEQGFYGTVTELIYFFILALIPIYSIVRYGKDILLYFKLTRVYLLLGFLFYAVSVGASFLGSAFHSMLDKNIYMLAGNYLLEVIVTLGDQEVVELYSSNKDWISFYLMDSPVEETLELLGVGFLLAACLAYHKELSYKKIKYDIIKFK